MPLEALRTVPEHFDRILRHVNPKRIAIEMERADKAFHFRNFKGYRLDKIGRGRIKKIAQREIFKEPGNELFANLIVIHWNEAQGQMYDEIVAHVQSIDEDVEAVERIEPDKAHLIIDDMLTRHDRDDFYLCVRLNGVRFDEDVIQARLVRGEPAPSAAEGPAPDGDAEPKDASADEPKDAAADEPQAAAADEPSDDAVEEPAAAG